MHHRQRTLAALLLIPTALVTALATTPASAEDVTTDGTGQVYPSESGSTPSYVAPELLPAQPLAGQITQNQAASSSEMVSIQNQTIPSNIDTKNFEAVQITFKNQLTNPVSILQAEVTNAVDESVAVADVYERKRKKAAVLGGVLRGATGAMSFLPMVGGYAGYGTYMAANAASHATYSAASAAEAVANASAPGSPTGQFQQKVQDVFINPGESYTFKTLVPRGVSPQLRVFTKNLMTNEIQTLQR